MVRVRNPYIGLPDSSYWKTAVARMDQKRIDPHCNGTLRFDRSTRIASAGSCFAQRISTALRQNGFNYLVTESGPPWLSADDRAAFNYGVYSARYGNIYTPLQFLQLFQRAFGYWETKEPFWIGPQKGLLDPLRPTIQPGGFASEAECERDRRDHLGKVRQLFETADVFVFTLGLTEGWQSVADGTMFPMCPGSGCGGKFDPSKYRFHNFSSVEVIGHMQEFIAGLAKVNPRMEIVLTVSPIPLIATMEPRHIMQANCYSKSVLRVAAEHLVRMFPHVHYFASYEIVTGSATACHYFGPDQRSLTTAAVSHVMWSFFRQFAHESLGEVTNGIGGLPAEGVSPDLAPPAMCDEDLIVTALAQQSLRDSAE